MSVDYFYLLETHFIFIIILNLKYKNFCSYGHSNDKNVFDTCVFITGCFNEFSK